MVGKNIATLAGVVGIVLGLGLSTVAQAQEVSERGLYAGIGLELFDTHIKGSDNGTPYSLTTRPLSIVGRAGYNIIPWLSVEAFGGTGIHDDKNDGRVGNNQAIRNGDTKLKYVFGGAIKPQYSYNFEGIRPITFYLLGGYATFKLEGDARNTGAGVNKIKFDRDEDDFYYGGGVQLDGDNASFILQYVDYARGGGFDVDGYQVSINYYF